MSAPLILIVEDEEEIAYIVRQVLQENGYRCQTAINGFEAMSILQAAKPDGIILDLSLPGISGFEILQRISKYAPAAKVFVVTGHVLDYGELVNHLGIVEVMEKPVALENLVASVRRVLPPD